MSYLIICLLALRIFICEKTMPLTGIVFDACFCVCFLAYLIFQSHNKLIRKIIFYQFAFIAALLLSSLHSVNAYNSQNEVLKFFIYALIFTFVFIQSREKKEMLIHCLIGISLIVSARAIYQYFSGLAYINSNYSLEQITAQGFYAIEMLKQKRVVSCFLTPGLLAGYLVMIIPVIGGYIVKNNYLKNIKKMILYSSFFLSACLGLFFTSSLAAVLSLGLAVFVGGLIGLRIKNQSFTFKKLIFVGILFLICLAVIFAKRAGPGTGQGDPKNSFIQRIYYWQAAKQMAEQSPLLGIGPGNFGIVYPRFKPEQANETIYAHNILLQFYAEAGMIGLIMFVLFVFQIYKRFSQNQKEPVEIGLIIGSCAFLIYNLFDYSFFVMQNGYIWWMITACMISPHRQNKYRKQKSFSADFFTRLAFVMISAGCVYYLSLEYKSQKYLDQAIDLLKNQKTDQAISQANMALHYRLNNDMIYYFLSHCYAQKTKNIFSHIVVDYYQKAIKLNPQYSFYYYYLGNYYFANRSYQKAADLYKQAQKLYPANQKFSASYQAALRLSQ
jgi:O-antigen ligase